MLFRAEPPLLLALRSDNRVDLTMGFDNYNSGDDEEEQNQDPSGTHIYFYEEGHDRLPEDEEVADALADAYDLARTQPTDGAVRSLANAGWDGGLVHMLAEYVNAVGEFLDQDNPQPMLAQVMEDFSPELQAQTMMSYLKANPEVGAELQDLMAGGSEEDQDEEPAAAEADD